MAKEKSRQYGVLRKEYNEKYDKGKLFEEIALYIRQHIKEDLSVDVICKNMGISQATLNRIFRQYANDSYKGYLTTIRIKEALIIMKNVPGISIKELAYEVGFNDQFYFSKVFKSIMGVNPSEYKYN